VLNLVFGRGIVGLDYQPPVTRKVLLVDETLHCDLRGTWAKAQADSRFDAFSWREPVSAALDNALMIVGDDGMLTAETQGAVTFHVDGISRFAFPGRVDRPDGSDKAVAGWMIDPVADCEFCFHLRILSTESWARRAFAMWPLRDWYDVQPGTAPPWAALCCVALRIAAAPGKRINKV
jgi:hypothetical protein